MNNNINSPITGLAVYDINQTKEKSTAVSARPFCSLSLRKFGLVRLNVDGKTLVSKEGCITFIPNGKSYFTEVAQNTHMIAIHFNQPGKGIFDEAFIIENAGQPFEQLFDYILKSYSTENANNYECYSHFYKLLAGIEKHFIKKQEGKILPAVSEAKALIEKNFRDNDFNIDALVSMLDISASYLRSEFRKSYSLSPIEYLKYVRHQNALSLLASDYYSVEEIAGKCGYGSSSYFIQAFRSTTGYSPLKYKERYLSR